MKKPQNVPVAISLVLLAFALLYAFNKTIPEANLQEGRKPEAFSVNRALVHLEEITKKPHFVGAEDHERVANYLIETLKEMGLKVSVQEANVFSTRGRSSARVKNILGVLPSKSSKGALMLMSHYDSGGKFSYGASDDGSGVVTILEALRAFIASGQQAENDIYVLFSDGEELGLLGAKAFVEEHPLAENIDLVINFEARGSGGSAFMFVETNHGSKKLIEAFQAADVPFPRTSSLHYSIYKLLPNDTDLTMFKQLGDIGGYNIAFIDDHFDYHTSQDNFERLDRNSLEHEGGYLQALLAHLASADLKVLESEEESIFFVMPGLGVVTYPYAWNLPILAGSALILLLLLGLSLRSGKLKPFDLLKGFLPLILSILLLGLVNFYGWKLVLWIHPGYREILQGYTYNGFYYEIGFSCLSIFMVLKLYQRFLKGQDNSLALYLPVLILWWLISWALYSYVPGGSFVIFNLLSGLVILGLYLTDRLNSGQKMVLSTLIFLPTLMVLAPVFSAFPLALGLAFLGLLSLLACLMLLVLLPVLTAIPGWKNLNKIFLITGLLALTSAAFSSSFDQDNRRPDSLVYFLDQERQKAYFLSYDLEPDSFTEQFLGEEPTKGDVPVKSDLYRGFHNAKLHTEARALPLQKTEMSVLQDSLVDGNRYLKLKLKMRPNTGSVYAFLDKKMNFKALEVGGAVLDLGENTREISGAENRLFFKHTLQHHETELVISFITDADGPVRFGLFSASFDLLQNPLIKVLRPRFKNRTEAQMEKSFVLTDALVSFEEIKVP